MSMQRWDPFREMQNMRETMERLFQESVLRPATNIIPGMRNTVPVDVIEREDGYVVRAALPGVRPDDVQATLQGNLLVIRGEASQTRQASDSEETRGQRWLARECRLGTFYRAITLPAAVDADQATARFRHGMLELTLPKAEVHRARRINIQGASTMNTMNTNSPNGNGGPNTNASGASKPTGKPQRQDTPQGAKPQGPRDESRRDGEKIPYDIVNEASEESFPASDAPSWTRERD